MCVFKIRTQRHKELILCTFIKLIGTSMTLHTQLSSAQVTPINFHTRQITRGLVKSFHRLYQLTAYNTLCWTTSGFVSSFYNRAMIKNANNSLTFQVLQKERENILRLKRFGYFWEYHQPPMNNASRRLCCCNDLETFRKTITTINFDSRQHS